MNTKKPPLERAIVKKTMDTLNSRGGFWFKSHGSVFQLIGLPDIIGCYHGRFIAFEVKRSAAETLTARQEYAISRIRKAGGVALRIHSAQMAEAILDRIKREYNVDENRVGVESAAAQGVHDHDPTEDPRPRVPPLAAHPHGVGGHLLASAAQRPDHVP